MSAKTKSKKTKASKAKTAKPKSNPAPKKAKATPAPKPKTQVEAKAPAERKETKMDTIIGLLKREDGATIEQIIAETNWQKHTVRSAISHGLAKKRGYKKSRIRPKASSESIKSSNDYYQATMRAV